ncbi:hypothetical protein EN12_22150 [Vibrio cholerae]|uniref:ParA family protein n=1 Tax=Vibrio cholerae TaxID=666 RepID=A0A5B1BZ13_VIBCL|nr:ParA family protein [Vibrio cholerae]AKO77807.1 hypothetical protein EN12_22150 [Vibrio cholerae]KAA1252663.1 ParA family protein [Vibrio cholerae]HDV5594877.1 ParA family protein [Vibrio cholerae]
MFYDTRSEVYALAATAEEAMAVKQTEICCIANKKDMRHFTLADAKAFLGPNGPTEKTIKAYCTKLGIDPTRFREEGSRWLINIKDIYKIREALHNEPKNKLKYPKFNRSKIQELLIITFANQKGGACKTTNSVHLGAGLALRHEQYRVLIVDLDKQQNLSTYYSPASVEIDGLNGDNEFTIGDLVLETYLNDIPDGMSEAEYVYNQLKDTTIPNLFVLPCRGKDTSLAKDMEDIASKNPDINPYKMLKDKLKMLDDYFDVVIVDTPPSIDLHVCNALYASDLLYIPLQPNDNDLFATLNWLTTLPEVFEIMSQYGFKGYKDRIGILMSNYRKTKSQGDNESKIMSLFPNNLMPCKIEFSEAILKCSNNMQTVFDLSPSEYREVHNDSKAIRSAVINMNAYINQIKFDMDKVWSKQKEVA